MTGFINTPTSDDILRLERRIGELEDRLAKLEKQPKSKELATTKQSRGTRLPGKDSGGWIPEQKTIDKIKAEFPSATPDQFAHHHRMFCDWAYSSASRNAVKKDWELTWCNWMRRELGKMYGSTPKPSTDDKVQGWMEVGRGSE